MLIVVGTISPVLSKKSILPTILNRKLLAMLFYYLEYITSLHVLEIIREA